MRCGRWGGVLDGFVALLAAVVALTDVAAAEPRASAVARGGSASPEAIGATGGTARLVSVIVKLEDPPVARHTQGKPGLPPTSPQVTGARRLDRASPTVQAYRAHLAGKQAAFEATARAALPGAQVLHRYQMVLGGVAMLVPENQLPKLSALPGVVAVYRDEALKLHTDRSPTFIGAKVLWGRLGGQKGAGEGVIVGIIDTGIWPEHPSFSDPDPAGNAYPAPPPPARDCQFTGGANPGDPFTCNNKLIGAYRFMTAYELCVSRGECAMPSGDFTSARDGDGHGTHTASTAAGNGRVEAEIFGIERGRVSGIAPRAHVIAYKVCGVDTCFASDSVAAVEQALLDGVDVLNFSIGGGSNPYFDAVELAFLDAYAAGVFVAASAGNDGPSADTVEHRGPWVTTVGASTQKRLFLTRLTLAASDGARLTLEGASITPGLSSPAPVVSAATVGDPRCLDGTPDAAFAGKVVVCARGTNARIEKSYNVQQRGGVAMILYNASPLGIFTDNHVIPAVHLDGPEGTELLAFLGSHAVVTASFPAGKEHDTAGDVMAAFSSRGGTGLTQGVLKPDVTAPGVQILAGNSPVLFDPASAPGELFQAIQGTSMSSPHVAGSAALLQALHPTWTAGQIKSALMTTGSTKNLVQEDGEHPFTPFDAGSGRIDLQSAGAPGITFDVSAADYAAHAGVLWSVNYPSLYLPASAPDAVTVQRTARSEDAKDRVWSLEVTTSPDLTVRVPPSITVPGGGAATFAITVDKSGLRPGQARHATLEMKSGPYRAHLPITAVHSTSLPDLEITALTVTSPLTPGASYTLSTTVRNNGPVNAGHFFMQFYITSNTDGTLSADDVFFAFCDYTGMAAGTSGPCSFTVNFGPERPVSPGSYRVIGIVDSSGEVGESNETNNTFLTAPITVN